MLNGNLLSRKRHHRFPLTYNIICMPSNPTVSILDCRVVLPAVRDQSHYLAANQNTGKNCILICRTGCKSCVMYAHNARFAHHLTTYGIDSTKKTELNT